MAYDTNNLVKLGQLKIVTQSIYSNIDATETIAGKGFKSGDVSGNTVSFYTTDDKSGTAAFSFDFPEELFLDATGTKFEGNFKFADGSYGTATDPDLDGKPVFVLAVKTKNGSNETISYSFLDMAKLVDTYSAKAGDSAKILNINGYEIEVKISAETDNAIEVKSDGLYVAAPTVAGATDGNIAKFNAAGKIVDGGIAASDILTTANLATDEEVAEMLTEVFGASGT